MGKHARPKRRGLASLLISALLFSGLAFEASVAPKVEPASAAGTCAAGVVTPLHGPKAYYDNKTDPDSEAMYLGYRITPTASLTDAKVKLTIGNNKAVDLQASQPDTETLGTISSGSSGYVYFLAKVRNQPNSALANITVQLYDGNTLVCDIADNSIVTSKSTIRANANKIYTARVTGQGTTVGLGSRVVVTVTGNTGTIGSGPDATREINLAPVTTLTGLNPAAWRLEKVSFKSQNAGCNAGSQIDHRLYISNATSPSSANCGGLYSANYVFSARSTYTGANVTNQVQAFAYIASGNLIKHTTPFSSVIGLPTLDKTSNNVVSGSEPDLATELSTAAIPFSANDVNILTSQNVDVTAAAISFFNESNGIDWGRFCIVNPSNSTCGTSNVTITNGASQTGGTFSIVSMSDGTKRVRYSPGAATLTTGDVAPAEVEFRLYDGAGNEAVGLAVAEVSNTFLANSVDFVALGTNSTESPTITSQNGTIDPTLTCIWNGTACVSLPFSVAGVGSWNLTSANTKVQFTAASGFSGEASVDLRLQTSGGGSTAYGTATVTVIGAPSVFNESASTSPTVFTTLSPTVDAQSNVTRCIYLSEPAPSPCSATSATATSISWTLRQDGVVSFSSLVGFTGLTSVIYGVTDTYGQFASASMTVEVLAPSLPTISAEVGQASTSQAVTLSPTLSASSSYTICLVISGTCASSPQTTGDGTWTIVGNQVGFTSKNTFTGSATIPVKITDLFGQTATATQTVTVNAPAAPKVNDVSGATITTTPKTVTPVATSTLTTTGCLEDQSTPGTCASGNVTTAAGTWTTASGNVTFTAASGFTGTTTIGYIVTDTVGQTGSATVSIIVNAAGAQLLGATTSAATSVTSTTAVLNGVVAASGVTSNIYFCYGTSSNLSNCNLIAGSPSTVAGNSSTSANLAVSGLTAGTEYWFKIVGGDGSSTESGAVLSFSTQVVVQQTTPPAPAPTQEPVAQETFDPCVQNLSLEAAANETELITYFAQTFQVMFSGLGSSVEFGLSSLASNDLALGWTSTKIATSNPLLGGMGVLQSATEMMFEISFLAKAKPTALEPEDVLLAPGANLGEVEVTTKDGDPLEILSIQSIDLNLYVEYTGAELNNPLLWQNMGYGLLCWKLEPFTETSFILPNPIDLPAGTPAGNWVYSNVIVKAGSITADPTTFQANTLFPKPGPGNAVWADVNGNGIYDPGGKNGDKAISHIVICADLLTESTPTPTPTQTAGSTEPTTPAPTPTVTETPTSPAPTVTTTASPIPTQTATTPVPATPAPPVTPSPSATPSPTATSTPAKTLCASPIPTNTTDKPKISEPTPLPTSTPKIIIKVSPLSTPVPTPTPTTPGSTPTPTTPGSTPSPTPTTPGSTTPAPTPTTPGATPSPTQTSTPAPTTPGATPTPTTPGSTPAPTTPGTPTPGETTTPVPTIDLTAPEICEPSAVFSVAMKVSNGLSTTCIRVTSAYFNSLAFAPRELPEEKTVVALEGEEVLADTGAETSTLVLWALMLFGAGMVFTFLARRRD